MNDRELIKACASTRHWPGFLLRGSIEETEAEIYHYCKLAGIPIEHKAEGSPMANYANFFNGKIWLVPKSVWDQKTPRQRVESLIHELTHERQSREMGSFARFATKWARPWDCVIYETIAYACDAHVSLVFGASKKEVESRIATIPTKLAQYVPVKVLLWNKARMRRIVIAGATQAVFG